MDINSVLELLDAVERTGWTKFEVNQKDFSLKLERNTDETILCAPKAQRKSVKNLKQEEIQEEIQEKVNENEKIVDSPLVGLYHNPKNEISIEQNVKKGTVICLIEAMKLMNEITMPEDGKITWIACAQGDAVEFGQLLFKYSI